MTMTDELTGLYNRRGMQNIVMKAHDNGVAFSLLMADIDDFKMVNDTHGHDCGDKVLEEVGELLKSNVRDIRDAAVGRWGGEEFVIFLPNTNVNIASSIAEGLRTDLEEASFAENVSLTISLGVIDSALYEDMRSVYKDVDRALYSAKQAGKNRVVIAGAAK